MFPLVFSNKHSLSSPQQWSVLEKGLTLSVCYEGRDCDSHFCPGGTEPEGPYKEVQPHDTVKKGHCDYFDRLS